MSHCPTPKELGQLLAEGTGGVIPRGVGDHVATCTHCREVLGQLTLGRHANFAPRSGGETVLSAHAPAESVFDPYSTVAELGRADSVPVLQPYQPSTAHVEEPQPTSGDTSYDPYQTTAEALGRPRPSAPEAPEEPQATLADAADDPYRTTAGPVGDPYRTTADALDDPYRTTADLGPEPPGARKAPSRGSGRVVGALLADFEILGELGRGGMGVVYKARQRRLQRLVALKMIRGDDEHPEHLARFRTEAEAVARLHHTNILQIYDIGEADGHPYVSLELLEGGSLAERLKGTPQPGRTAAEWLVPLALAMEAAHQAGIVHRDLKPANVLFSAQGVPKVTDFGLAKLLEVEEGQTHTGQVMGTPSYMAPEQARGHSKEVGPSTDIYALGAILYEMLTGRPPFRGTSQMETVRQVIEGEPVAPSRLQNRVSRDLETICLKCLEKDTRKRYARAQDLADDLNRYLAGKPIRARPTPAWERGLKWARRRPTTATLLALGLFTTLGLLIGGLRYRDYLREQERRGEKAEAALRVETANDLVAAQDALARRDWPAARLILSKRLVKTDKQPGLASLHERAATMLNQVEKELAGQEEKGRQEARYRRFLALRDDAFFHDTRFTGLDLPVSLELTRHAAEAALDVFAEKSSGADWKLETLPGSLSEGERAVIRDGCYELLLVLAEAVATQDAAQVPRALQMLEQADSLRPKRTRAFHLRKAACLARLGDKSGETSELAAAERIQPDTAFGHFLSGQQQYRRGHWDEAIRHFESALRLKPDHFWAQALLAICYLQSSRVAEAKPALNACLQAHPDYTWLYLLRGYAHGQLAARALKSGRDVSARESQPNADARFEFDEAEKDFQNAEERLKLKPDDDLQYVLLVNRGLIRFQRGKWDEAAGDFRAAIQVKPKHFEAYAELAHVFQRQVKPAEAVRQFDRAIALRPGWAPLYRGRAGVYLEKADATPEQRDAALGDLERAIRCESPGNRILAQDQTNRGDLFFRAGRYEDALGASEAALRAAPDFAEAHRLRVKTLLELKRYEETLRACEEAMARGKPSAVLYELRGLARSGRLDYAGAVADFTRSLDLQPAQVRVLNERGRAYLLCEAAKLALEDFSAAIGLDPGNADSYNGRGMAHVALGNHRAAAADVRESLQRGPVTARLAYNAARLYAQAAVVAAAEAGNDPRLAARISTKYQDLAVALIRESFRREVPEKRAQLWRETIQADPALRAIRRRLKYEDLVAPVVAP